jgi:murein DD-endopeptidase MepM/ murein hydrolase activator NlpD
LTNAIRTFFLAVLWSAVLGISFPLLDSALHAARLASMPAPPALEMPVAGVKRGALRDTWHAPRPGGRRHEGIDIFAEKGTPVRATTRGIVIRHGRNRLGGNVVWVLGPGGQRHYFAHLDGFAYVSAGERIQAGRVLGYVGNTGNAKTTPPHLHYGIYSRSAAVNPFPLLVDVID